MALNLHPNAIANFNSKAEALRNHLSIRPPSSPERDFQSELYVDRSFNADDIIGEQTQGEIDFTGQECARYFVVNGQWLGLHREGYKEFHKLCEAIQRTQALYSCVSLDLVKDEVFAWLKSCHIRGTTLPLVQFILPHLAEEVKEIEIWVPIFGMLIQSQFSLGEVSFRPISKVQIEEWRSAMIDGRTEGDARRISESFENERKEIQGLPAGTIKLTADPDRAGQLALNTVERVLNVLRFFEPANFHPKLVSHCALLGKQNLQTTKHYVVEHGTLTTSTQDVVDPGFQHWKISDDLLVGMRKDGLDMLHKILLSNARSDFQNTIIDTLQVYSRSTSSSFYSDKILYILSALESLLLRNDSEPIQQNVGERMAFALTRNPENRKRIVKNFREVYDLRSDFVHHANDIQTEQIDRLHEFMLNAWHFLRSVIQKSDTFQSKQQMIEAIENVKYS